MPKIKNITPLSLIESEMKVNTEQLYENTPSSTPPAPVENKTASESNMAYQKEQTPLPASETRKQTTQEEQKENTVGRKKGVCTIPRKNGKLIFFEDRHNKAVEDIHWQCKVDRQDVVRTALNEFLKKYMVGEGISPEGEELIRQYYNETHT